MNNDKKSLQNIRAIHDKYMNDWARVTKMIADADSDHALLVANKCAIEVLELYSQLFTMLAMENTDARESDIISRVLRIINITIPQFKTTYRILQLTDYTDYQVNLNQFQKLQKGFTGISGLDKVH